MRRLLIVLTLGLVLLTQVAANGVLTLPVALAVATVVAGISPLVLGLVRQRYPNVDGNAMAGISFLIAAVITVGAALSTGELKVSDFSDVSLLAGSLGWLWSVQQGVYKLINASKPHLVGPKPA